MMSSATKWSQALPTAGSRPTRPSSSSSSAMSGRPAADCWVAVKASDSKYQKMDMQKHYVV